MDFLPLPLGGGETLDSSASSSDIGSGSLPFLAAAVVFLGLPGDLEGFLPPDADLTVGGGTFAPERELCLGGAASCEDWVLGRPRAEIYSAGADSILPLLLPAGDLDALAFALLALVSSGDEAT